MKAIFFDIDGTLVAGGTHKMSDSTIKAIKKARENGNICMINTGRAKSFVGEDLRNQVEFDGFLMGCGTEIEYHGEILMHKRLPYDLTVRIMEGLKRYGIDTILEGSESNFVAPIETYITPTFRKYVEKFDKKYYTSWDEAPGNFDKFFCYVDEMWRMNEFKGEFESDLDFVDRENGFFEVLPKGYSKATAIEFIEKHLSIRHEDTVAIGDSNNDMPMLEYANIAIGMGNSSQTVIDMADYISTNCEDDGIYNALEWLGVL